MAVNANEPVDAVVMWVDGSDPEFVDSQNYYLKANNRPIINSAERHRDNGELRYVLRGLIHHTPWIRRIHVVTNGQKPSWLNFDSERIVHVKHKDIFPEADMIPCFNTFAIESCLHRIKGLAEVFIRLSDDFFVTRPASRQEVLGPIGLGRQIFAGEITDERSGAYWKQIKNNVCLMSAKLGHQPIYNYAHAPQVRFRTTFEQFVNVFADEITSTRRNRFRTPADLIPLFLYPYFHLWTHDRDSFHAVLEGKSTEYALIPENMDDTSIYKQISVGRRSSPWRRHLRKVVKNPPLYLNLNDKFESSAIEDDRSTMALALDQLFPVSIEHESF